MKIHLTLILVSVLTTGRLFAQNKLPETSNETALQNTSLPKGIKFINKDSDNVAFSHLNALDTFSFEGEFKKPTGAKELTVQNCSFNKSHFQGPYFQIITFDNCSFQKAPIFKSLADNIDTYIYDADFEDCTFTDGLNLSKITVGDGLSVAGKISGQLDLSNMTVDHPSTKINLMGLYPNLAAGVHTDISGKISIDLDGAPIANIIMDYNRFTLDTATLEDEQITGIYAALLANFKTRGFDESYESADVDYQKYKNHSSKTYLGKVFLPFIDVLQHYWWYYGYEKFRILVITPMLLLIFTLINLALYKRLNKESYTVNDEEIAKEGMSFYNSLVYTSVIFFRLPLNWKTCILKVGVYRYGSFLFIYQA